MHHSKLFILFSLLVVVSSADRSWADDYSAFVFAACSQPKYTPGTPYDYNVDALLTSLANSAAASSYGEFTSRAASSSYPAYGFFQCRGNLQVSDCDSCVHSAISQLPLLCASAAGGAVQLHGCVVRYGNNSFLGETDTSLLHTKCGADASDGYNSEVFGMRDAALAAVEAGQQGGGVLSGGLYRVGAAGHVQAMAQCVGDQRMDQCNDCVSVAVEKVKSACTPAVGGDVYLGKCYVSYWSNGACVSHCDHGKQTGKTLAIIIGVMGGVALIILFLALLRKARNYEDY